jgi:nuclear receptor subfamily 1 group I
VQSEQQRAVLVSVFQECSLSSNVLYWAGMFVVERNTWLTPPGEVDAFLATSSLGNANNIRQLLEFERGLKSLFKNNNVLFALAQILHFFQPGPGRQVDQQLINAIHDKYLILLKHYLQSQYSYVYADLYFRAITKKVEQLKQYGDMALCFLVDFYHECPQLIKEITNLTPNMEDNL